MCDISGISDSGSSTRTITESSTHRATDHTHPPTIVATDRWSRLMGMTIYCIGLHQAQILPRRSHFTIHFKSREHTTVAIYDTSYLCTMYIAKSDAVIDGFDAVQSGKF